MKELIKYIPLSKVAIKKQAFNYGEKCEDDGTVIETIVQSKALEQFAKDLRGKLEDSATEEISKYEGRSTTYQGVDVAVRSSNRWDYSTCQDTYLDELLEEKAKWDNEIKQRQLFLRGIKEPQETPHPGTGELIKVYPPQQTGKEIPFITLKKI